MNKEENKTVDHYGFEILTKRINDLEDKVVYQDKLLDDVVNFLRSVEQPVEQQTVQQNMGNVAPAQPVNKLSTWDKFWGKK